MNIIFWDKEQFFSEIKKATNNNENTYLIASV